MKIAIIYYSFSGNTRIAAQALQSYLKDKGEVKIAELKAVDESANFFSQCWRAFLGKKAKILPVDLELSGFDLICLGTPVWAFGPAPAINSYLDQCAGLTDKSVVLFTTYGSGTGNDNCLDKMQKILNHKGVKTFSRFSIPQIKIKDKEFVLSRIKEALRLWPNG